MYILFLLMEGPYKILPSINSVNKTELEDITTIAMTNKSDRVACVWCLTDICQEIIFHMIGTALLKSHIMLYHAGALFKMKIKCF